MKYILVKSVSERNGRTMDGNGCKAVCQGGSGEIEEKKYCFLQQMKNKNKKEGVGENFMGEGDMDEKICRRNLYEKTKCEMEM